MSDISENLQLFYLKGSDPRDYRLSLTIDESNSQMCEPGQFSHETGEQNENGLQYNVSVQMNEIPQGYSELSVLLGSLTIPLSNVWFNLDIKDNNGTQVAHGTIRIEEGEQEIRPIKAL